MVAFFFFFQPIGLRLIYGTSRGVCVCLRVYVCVCVVVTCVIVCVCVCVRACINKHICYRKYVVCVLHVCVCL